MFFLRYLLAIVFSFLIHGIAFPFSPSISLDLGLNTTHKSSIAIQFIQPKKENSTERYPENSAKEVAKEPEKVMRKIAPTAPKEEPKTAVKTDKQAVVKALKKEPKVVKKVVQEKPKNGPITEKLVKKESDEKHKERHKTEKAKQTTSASSTKQSAPKMVKKITFSARPTPIDYPHSAKKRNIEGVVLVEVWLDETGKQTKQRIINSSGHQILDTAALKGVSKWLFSSQQDSGQAIAYRVQVPINFGLN